MLRAFACDRYPFIITSVKKRNGKIRRFSHFANKNNFSAEDAQSSAEGILNRLCSPWNNFALFHGLRLKKVGVFLGQLAAKAADTAVQMPLHQRLKGGKVAPLDGVQQVAVVCDHLVQPAGGHGVQHTEPAVIGVGVL